MKIPFISKQAFKRRAGSCRICPEKVYELLDCHRIIYGGDYSDQNCVCLCVKCHRKEHNQNIKIIGWVDSSMGKLLHYIDEDGIEQFT